LIWLLAVALVIGGFVVARQTWKWVRKAWDEALIAAREKGFYA
jgi:branched-chain amino acid transport system permease protein